MSSAREQRLAATFVTLADTLVAEFDVLDFLTLLTERAVELLDVSAAGVMLSDQRGGWRPTATSSEHAELVHLFASQTRGGPCQDAAHTGAPVASPDLNAEADRWPDFVHAATHAGYHAAYAIPMRLREQTIGSLTLLNNRTTPVDQDSAALGQALADVATIGLLQHRAVHRQETLSEQLQAALHWRTVVEQAKGTLAEAGNLDMHQAYTLLRNYAHHNHRPLSQLAHDLATGQHTPDQLLTHHHRPDTHETQPPKTP
ncbi:GAF and ANTAR domain-containing protein [Sciscionella marina]|uniref:GAF and ANTAR domain-containing protein n=1 Tax=Sciscionella marina TaxID=508770 RepID=UPI00036C919A|nr:GAF and ANTAR domain-containing protein [Sciscionella marina]